MCQAQDLLFQGHVLVYDPTHNATKWVQFKGIVSDVMPAEEAAADKMLDYIPVRTQPVDIWLDSIGEMRTLDSSHAEAPAIKVAEDPTAGEAEDSITEEEPTSDSGTGEPTDKLKWEVGIKAASATEGMVVAVQILELLMDMGPGLPV